MCVKFCENQIKHLGTVILKKFNRQQQATTQRQPDLHDIISFALMKSISDANKALSRWHDSHNDAPICCV